MINLKIPSTHLKQMFIKFIHLWRIIQVNVYFFKGKIHNDVHFFLLAHGTHIGHIRLESRKPQQVPIDSEIHFGASTRLYIIRERPQAITGQISDDNENRREDLEGGLLGLPETETELDVNSIIHVLNMQILSFTARIF